VENNFKENWTKILQYNEKIKKEKDLTRNLGKVRIPFTNIRIEHRILFLLLKKFYPEFISSQNNVVDVIVSDDGNEIHKIYLYKTDEPGIYENMEIMDKSSIKYKKNILQNPNGFFDSVQERFQKKYEINISQIRIFKNKAIELLNKLLEKVNTNSINEQFSLILDVMKEILLKNHILFLPEPLVISFSRSLCKFLENFSLGKILVNLLNLIPDFNYSFLISSKKFNLIITMNNLEDPLDIEVYTPSELGLHIDKEIAGKLIENINEKLKTEKTIHLRLTHLIALIKNLIELDFPLKQNELELLLQKFIYFYRKYDVLWNQFPKPITYNSLTQFFFRLITFNINLQKISHWAIPKFFLNYKDRYFGVNCKILVIITNSTHKLNLRVRTNNSSINSKSIFILEYKNRDLVNVIPINSENLLDKKDLKLSSLKNKFSKEYGFISSVIKLDMTMIRSIINNFFFDLNRLNIFPKIKVIRLLKDDDNFEVYPVNPLIKYLKDTNSIRIIKDLLPIFIDLHMF
jgi:hypothetical protein